METIGRSYLKLFMLEQRAKGRAVLWSREIDPTRQQNGFRKHRQNVAGDGFSFSLAVRKCIHPVTASSAQTNAISEEMQTIYSDHKPKTVHVRFKLVKECLFGQQFIIVGNDPIIGSWDPSEGVPLDWSEGHVWTAELDIPSDNVFEYKFILKGETGGISWQPGPDRVFVTWDTDKTITVCEDWDNPQLQLIVEEEPVVVPDVNDEHLIDSDLLMVAENLIQPHEMEEESVNSDFSVADSNLNLPLLDEKTHMIEEVLANVNGHANHTSAHIVADNVIEESGEQDSRFSDEGSGLTSVTDLKRSSKDETRIVEDEGVPVLVPGLVIPVPPGDTEADEINEVVESNGTVENTTIEPGFTEDHHSTKPEIITTQLEEEHASASSSSSSLMDLDEKRQAVGAEHVENKSILETDMQWGRRTLQKLLANFGFQ